MQFLQTCHRETSAIEGQRGIPPRCGCRRCIVHFRIGQYIVFFLSVVHLSSRIALGCETINCSMVNLTSKKKEVKSVVDSIISTFCFCQYFACFTFAELILCLSQLCVLQSRHQNTAPLPLPTFRPCASSITWHSYSTLIPTLGNQLQLRESSRKGRRTTRNCGQNTFFKTFFDTSSRTALSYRAALQCQVGHLSTRLQLFLCRHFYFIFHVMVPYDLNLGYLITELSQNSRDVTVQYNICNRDRHHIISGYALCFLLAVPEPCSEQVVNIQSQHEPKHMFIT